MAALRGHIPHQKTEAPPRRMQPFIACSSGPVRVLPILLPLADVATLQTQPALADIKAWEHKSDGLEQSPEGTWESEKHSPPFNLQETKSEIKSLATQVTAEPKAKPSVCRAEECPITPREKSPNKPALTAPCALQPVPSGSWALWC